MGGRWTDDDDTHERHTDTNRLTRHTAQAARDFFELDFDVNRTSEGHTHDAEPVAAHTNAPHRFFYFARRAPREMGELIPGELSSYELVGTKSN